jgi:single-strand DNA-binding protein
VLDTYITVVGTALNTPEWRQLAKTNALVANFRVASHPRRYDRNTSQWVDAPSLRIRVNCWRRLAEGVCGSIIAGDPVVVHGRIATREWKNEQGETRLAYELEAVTVGHDLSRGVARFKRTKSESLGAVIDDADSESRINGEVAHPLTGFGSTRSLRDGDPLDDFDPAEAGERDLGQSDLDALAILRSAGLDPVHPDDEVDDGSAGSESGDGESADLVGDGAAARRRGRQPVPA